MIASDVRLQRQNSESKGHDNQMGFELSDFETEESYTYRNPIKGFEK
jgi:hypothetical protein